jgi:sn-glycerol 3-phosphate transport system permease protein
MVQRSPVFDVFTHLLLILAIALVGFPIYYAFVASTLTLDQVSQVPMPLVPSSHMVENFQDAARRGQLIRVLGNTFVVAITVAVGKIAISILSAFSVTYFRYRLRMAAFWLIFVTLMLPVEVRIVPTYDVAANLLTPVNWFEKLLFIPEISAWLGHPLQFTLKLNTLNTFPGLILPLVASATATFVFRQFFLTIPDELCEQAKIDGAGPMRFFWSIMVPMSRTNMAALVVILFVYGWNQYLWPLLVTTDPTMNTAMIMLRQMMPGDNDPQTWNLVMASALMVLVPPAVVVMVMQRWFVKGLIEGEK